MTATEEPSTAREPGAGAGATREPGAGVRVTLVQLPVNGTESPGDRLLMVKQQVAQAADGGAELVVLPEIWTTGAFDIDRGLPLAEPFAGPTSAALSALAAEHGIWLHGGSFLERDGARVYNTSTLFDPSGELAARYRKVHLFGFDTGEAALVTPGSELVVVPTPLGATALATCYDLRFPELFRAVTAAGAEAPARLQLATRGSATGGLTAHAESTPVWPATPQVARWREMLVDATSCSKRADHDPALVSATSTRRSPTRTDARLRDRRL
jgi:predicted amidohydrolase